MKKKEIEITAEKFESYLRVQFEGNYNMFDLRAIQATSLSIEEYKYIINNYDMLTSVYEPIYMRYAENGNREEE